MNFVGAIDVPTVVSVIALVVAFLTLYLSLLRHAEIDIDHVPPPRDFDQEDVNGIPVSTSVEIALFASNSGVHGGLLTSVTAEKTLEYVDGDSGFWSVLEGANLWGGPGRERGLELPLPLAPGENRTLFAELLLRTPGSDPTAAAKRLSKLTQIAVEISWEFVRTAGLPLPWKWFPQRFRWHRKSVLRSQRLVIDVSRYREIVTAQWEHNNRTDLVAIVRGVGLPHSERSAS
jgi:hypothetical protein